MKYYKINLIVVKIAFILGLLTLSDNIFAEERSFFEINGKDIAYGDRGKRPSYVPGDPQIEMDLDSDGMVESLHFYTDANQLKCKFIKSDKNGNYIEDFIEIDYTNDDYFDSDYDPRNGKINVNLHDFDKDGIPEIIIEVIRINDEYRYKEAYTYGEIYKLNGKNAKLNNLEGLTNWLQKVGDYSAQDLDGGEGGAWFEDNLIHAGSRQMPQDYVYVRGKIIGY